MNEIIRIIILPVAAGLLLFLIPGRFRIIRSVAALLSSAVACYLAFTVYFSGNELIKAAGTGEDYGLGAYITFNIDSLSRLILIFIALISFVILLYSVVYKGTERIKSYYSWYLITLGCAIGAVLSDNLLLFLGFWGILGITLYKLIKGYDEQSSAAAKKTLILIGSSDSIMIIGIALVWRLTGSLSMQGISIPTDNSLSVVAFLALIIGSFTKAGAFPFHSWVPDYSLNAPASSSAYLPASLDKLLGIYFLARITTGMFILNEWLTLLLLSIGVISIIVAVMMALDQHSYRKLLGFHAVSQVGYMIVGFGLGSMIGVAAGIFHMLNNVLYKSGLFLTAGCVEQATGKDDIDDLGGLSASMPVTFIASLVFAVSISGIPPFSGFASKWMIYQGIIEFGSGSGIANRLWVIWLGLAVLGSALTLASFIKLIGGVYLGRRNPGLSAVKEVPALMWIPVLTLALVSIFFGVFPTSLVVPELIMPVTGEFQFAGLWSSTLVSMLVLISLLIGVMVYFSLKMKNFRSEDSFIGGERIQDETGYPVTGFYHTIREFRIFSWLYDKAGEKWFDIYDLSKRSVLWVSHQVSETHTGILTGYLIWVLAGLIIMLLIMI